MLQIIKPPTPLPQTLTSPSVFLAGSIAMGQAINWQAQVAQAFHNEDLILLNPRRDDWDATWEQRSSNPQFRAQVEWELAAQEQATVIMMYFDPQTQAPITLLELGLFARSGKLIVCCPEGFWRRGNVEIVCQRYGAPMVADLAGLVAVVRQGLITE